MDFKYFAKVKTDRILLAIYSKFLIHLDNRGL